MFIKRQLPVIIMMSVGLLTLFGNFIKEESQYSQWIKSDSMVWFGIISAFAILLGAFNLLKIHFTKISRGKEDYPYSIILITGFSLMIFAGFFYHGTDTIGNGSWDKGEQFIDCDPSGKICDGDKGWVEGLGNSKYDKGEEFVDAEWGDHLFKTDDTLFSQIFYAVYTPLESTMFALLAFFVASASYRAFRIRNFEASLLLSSGILVMIGAVPFGSYIPSWLFAYILLLLLFAFISPFFKEKKTLLISFVASFFIINIIILFWYPSFLNSYNILYWILSYPTRAGKTAIIIGVGLGVAATSLRIIFGKDKSFLGD